MNKVLYDELLKAINEADEEGMVTDKEAEPDFTDQDDVENEEVPDIEDANDELKESIYEFLNDLKASGIPVTEDAISNVIYDHITNIVESAKLVGVSELNYERILSNPVALGATIIGGSWVAEYIRRLILSQKRAIVSCSVKKDVYTRNKCRIAVYNAAINQLKNGKNKCQKLKPGSGSRSHCEDKINKEIRKLIRLRDRHITENKVLKAAEDRQINK